MRIEKEKSSGEPYLPRPNRQPARPRVTSQPAMASPAPQRSQAIPRAAAGRRRMGTIPSAPQHKTLSGMDRGSRGQCRAAGIVS